jgi:anti-sigma regulatory factor (Ser/Thr protein kinase)
MKTTSKQRFETRVGATASIVGDVRKAVVAFAAELGFDDTAQIALAVSEAITNAVVHAYRDTGVGDVRVVACDEPDRLVVVVRDYGSGMLPRAGSPEQEQPLARANQSCGRNPLFLTPPEKRSKAADRTALRSRPARR